MKVSLNFSELTRFSHIQEILQNNYNVRLMQLDTQLQDLIFLSILKDAEDENLPVEKSAENIFTEIEKYKNR